MQVEKTMSLGQVLQADRGTARIFMEFGMHCLGCPHATAESLEDACAGEGMRAAFQCCEHLNRCVVMEKETLRDYGCAQVKAIPQPKAGGSVPAAAWKMLREPALALAVQADAAIDVGDTLVGMHIRPVAVPLRGAYRRLGEANLVQAYSRLPYIGGARAVYEEN